MPSLRPSAAGLGVSFQLTIYDDSTIAYRGADAAAIPGILRLIADHAERTDFAQLDGRPIPSTGVPMPNQPRPDNPARTFRCPDDLWERAKQRADERGETVSEAVRKFLERYAK